MPTNRERIITYLQANPDGVDDDELSTRLQIRPRQQVNQICRALEAGGVISRQKDYSLGKIVNRWLGSAGDSNKTPLSSKAAVGAGVGADQVRGRIVLLGDEANVRQFAYAGEVGLSEDNVKLAVTICLRQEGWEVETKWGQERGIDLVATRDKQRLILEAKGEGSRNQMRVNYFLGSLGELLQRMDTPGTTYGLALPAHRQFVGLMLRMPPWVVRQLNLRFYLVRPVNRDDYDVGLVTMEVFQV